MHVLLEMAKCAWTNEMDSILITKKKLIVTRGQIAQISKNCSMMNTTSIIYRQNSIKNITGQLKPCKERKS
jgi:hypothetical protein